MDKNPLFRGKLKICWTWSPLFPGVKLGAKGDGEEKNKYTFTGRKKKENKRRKKIHVHVFYFWKVFVIV